MKVLKFTIQDYSFKIHVILNTEVLKKENPAHIIQLFCKEKNLSTQWTMDNKTEPAFIKARINAIRSKYAMQYVEEWNSKTNNPTAIDSMLDEMGFEDE